MPSRIVRWVHVGEGHDRRDPVGHTVRGVVVPAQADEHVGARGSEGGQVGLNPLDHRVGDDGGPGHAPAGEPGGDVGDRASAEVAGPIEDRAVGRR